MQFSTSIVSFLAIAASTAATPLAARQNALQDWQVSSVAVFTPSGRPGSYPWATITANVTDPNEINLGNSSSDGTAVIVPGGSQGLNCEAKWFTRGESPLGRTWPCDPTSDGYWVMNVHQGTNTDGFSSTNFNLTFTHVADVLYRGEQYKASFEAQGHFEVGVNMQGTCGGSGVCSWGLKQESKPVRITPEKI